MSVSAYEKRDKVKILARGVKKKQSQTNPILVGPQFYWGLKSIVEKTKPIYGLWLDARGRKSNVGDLYSDICPLISVLRLLVSAEKMTDLPCEITASPISWGKLVGLWQIWAKKDCIFRAVRIQYII